MVEAIDKALRDIMRQEAMCIERATHKYLSGLSWWQRIFTKRHIRKNLLIESTPDGTQTLKTRKGEILLVVKAPTYVIELNPQPNIGGSTP